MESHEQWAWKGSVKVTITYLDGRQETEEFPNTICDTGRSLLRDALRGNVTDAKIYYVALGTSSTAPTTSDTQLGAEVFRKAVTSYSVAGANQVSTTVYIAPFDAVGTVIAEIGWFAGSAATASANTGALVAHVLYSHTKTAVESIQIVRTDTF